MYYKLNAKSAIASIFFGFAAFSSAKAQNTDQKKNVYQETINEYIQQTQSCLDKIKIYSSADSTKKYTDSIIVYSYSAHSILKAMNPRERIESNLKLGIIYSNTPTTALIISPGNMPARPEELKKIIEIREHAFDIRYFLKKNTKQTLKKTKKIEVLLNDLKTINI